VRHVLLLLLATVVPLAARADPLIVGRGLDQRLVAEVFASAFGFMAPRTLEPVTIPELALWALDGLSALDPRLRSALQDGLLQLDDPGGVLLLRPAPASDDARDWGQAMGELVRAAWDASPAVRQAGSQGVVRSLFDALCDHLDPYSRYAPPEEADADRERRAGAAGIGARVIQRGGAYVLADVAPDGPAAAAGARPGERLLAIDGRDIAGFDLDSVAALLAGPEGTGVVVTLRGRDGRTREAEIERRLVPPQTVQSFRQADLLTLRVSAFTSDTGARLAEALSDGLAGARRPRGVVIDLRGNRGGLLRQAVAAAGAVLPDGLVAVTVGRDPAAVHAFHAHGPDVAGGLPVVVLVDGASASGAEILAAALADQHRAVVVGSSTLGKGLVQTVAPLPDGGELLVTWSRVLAPLGWPIQGLGVLPQVCTSLGQPMLNRQLDQLAHGEQPMARALARHRAARPPLPAGTILEIRNACPAAEASKLDGLAAQRLLRDPKTYAAALLGPPPSAAPGGTLAGSAEPR
jgi:carboxyl-terminal processing protease